MRPHDADQIIESIGLGGHDWCPDDMRNAYEMDALETIAGMREEWGVAVTYPGLSEVVEWGFGTRDGAEAEGTSLDTEYRIVRRYVTTPEEA